MAIGYYVANRIRSFSIGSEYARILIASATVLFLAWMGSHLAYIG